MLGLWGLGLLPSPASRLRRDRLQLAGGPQRPSIQALGHLRYASAPESLAGAGRALPRRITWQYTSSLSRQKSQPQKVG